MKIFGEKKTIFMIKENIEYSIRNVKVL